MDRPAPLTALLAAALLVTVAAGCSTGGSVGLTEQSATPIAPSLDQGSRSSSQDGESPTTGPAQTPAEDGSTGGSGTRPTTGGAQTATASRSTGKATVAGNGTTGTSPQVTSGGSTSNGSGSTGNGPGSTSTSAVAAGPLTVRFTRAVAPKQWGDPPFSVAASANRPATITYSARGACGMGGAATVRVDAVGTCTVTATAQAAGQNPASDTLTVQVSRATPVISVSNLTALFTRPFSKSLQARVTPTIPLAYTLVPASSSPYCAVDGDGQVSLDDAALVASLGQYNGFKLPTTCTVSVSAASTSVNYVAPTTRQVSVQIDRLNYRLTAPAPKTVSWAALPSDHSVTLHFREDSGAGFGVYGGSVQPECRVSAPGRPVPAHTTDYAVTVTVPTQPTATVTCTIFIKPDPPDSWSENNRALTTLTVNP